MASTGAESLPSSAEFFISSLPGQPSASLSSIIQYAGYLPSHPSSTLSPPPDPHLWFWLIRSKHNARREKLVIWFNGGPGCSSLEGGFVENGPFRVKEAESGQLELEDAPIGWSEYANVMFIDQPAGTGFSYVNTGDDVRELAQAADQLVVFLTHFYRVFPEFSKIDTYLAGESFAGQYIPYFAQAILDTTVLSMPLLGILMGNPWIDPMVQYPAYLDFAYEKGLLVKGTAAGLRAEEAYKKCEQSLANKDEANHILVNACESALTTIIEGGAKTVNGTKMTPVVYNVTQLTADPSADWPPNVIHLRKYLTQEDTIKAFHAGEKSGKWQLCNNTVGNQMWVPNSAPSSTLIPGLVKKMKVMMYAGDQDYMCNALGVNRSIAAMEWNGQKGWGVDEQGNPVEAKDYFVNQTRHGSWIEARGMAFIKYDHASHLVPADIPYATSDMLLRFLEVDPIDAAGPAASVASQVGPSDSLGLVMKTHPNGTLLGGADGGAEHEKATTLGGPPILETVEERQAYYGPRQTVALVVLLSGLIVGLVMVFKWRRRRKGLRRARRLSVRMTRLGNKPGEPKSPFVGRVPTASERKKPRLGEFGRRDRRDENRVLLEAEEGIGSEAGGSRTSLGPPLSEPVKEQSQIFALGDEEEEFQDG